MKRLIALGFIIGSVLSVTRLYSEQIAYVHMDRVLNEYMDLKDAKQELQRWIREWDRVRDSLKAIVDTAKAQYERQRIMMSDEQKILKEREIKEYEKQYQEYWKSIWGKGGKVEQKTRELIDPLIKKVNETIYKIAQEMGYDLVLDISKDVVLYSSGKDDITDDVLEELNKEYVAASQQLGIKPKLAVFSLKEENQEASVRDLGTKVANFIHFGFKNSPKFDLIDRNAVQNVMNQQGIDLSTITLDQCYTMAQSLQADLFVFGSVRVEGDQAKFKIQLYSFLERRMITEGEDSAPADRVTELSVKAQNLALQLSQNYNP